MAGLMLLSLWLAFRRSAEIFFSLGMFVPERILPARRDENSGLAWNLLNLMALPLILGTGVDYSIFMQLALRRWHGRPATRASLGRARAAAVRRHGDRRVRLARLVQQRGHGQPRPRLRRGHRRQHAVFGFSAAGLVENISPGPEPGPGLGNFPRPRNFTGARFWQTRLDGSPADLARNRLCSALAENWPPPIYWRLAAHRREIVIQNLLPVLNNDRSCGGARGAELFTEFALKLSDLWRYESGVAFEQLVRATGTAGNISPPPRRAGKGVLLVTPHLGNWEFGGAFMARARLQTARAHAARTRPAPDRDAPGLARPLGRGNAGRRRGRVCLR